MLLEVFVRLLFSNRTELGWDDSIQRIASQVYKIRVGGKLYTTTKILCDISAEEIEGELHESGRQKVRTRHMW